MEHVTIRSSLDAELILEDAEQGALGAALSPEERVRVGELRLCVWFTPGLGVLFLTLGFTIGSLALALVAGSGARGVPWQHELRLSGLAEQLMLAAALAIFTLFGSGLIFLLRARGARPALVAGSGGLWLNGTMAGAISLTWDEVERVIDSREVGLDVVPTATALASRFSALQALLYRWHLIRVASLPFARDPALIASLEALRRAGLPGGIGAQPLE